MRHTPRAAEIAAVTVLLLWGLGRDGSRLADASVAVLILAGLVFRPLPPSQLGMLILCGGALAMLGSSALVAGDATWWEYVRDLNSLMFGPTLVLIYARIYRGAPRLIWQKSCLLIASVFAPSYIAFWASSRQFEGTPTVVLQPSSTLFYVLIALTFMIAISAAQVRWWIYTYALVLSAGAVATGNRALLPVLLMAPLTVLLRAVIVQSRWNTDVTDMRIRNRARVLVVAAVIGGAAVVAASPTTIRLLDAAVHRAIEPLSQGSASITDDVSFRLRVDQRDAAWRDVTDSPWVGNGLGRRVVIDRSPGLGNKSALLADTSLTTLVKVGFLGAVLWVSLWVFVLAQAARVLGSRARYWAPAVLLSLPTFSVNAALNDPFLDKGLGIAMVLILGASAGREWARPASTLQEDRGASERSSIAVAR